METSDFGKLIRGITANVNCYIGSKIEKFGIKQGQFEYFLLIYMTPGINQLELARLKNVGKASVTKALKILEEDGFIKRITDTTDRRHTLCYITKKGEIIAEDLLQIKALAERDIFSDFTLEDKTILLGYLKKLYKNTESIGKDD